MTILFVDDSPEFLKAVSDLCEYVCPERKVVCIKDSFEALNYITKNHKELSAVMTDLNMTTFGVSGEVIVDKCKEMEIPVVVCTGYDTPRLHRNPDTLVIEKSSTRALVKTLQNFRQLKHTQKSP